MVKVELGPFCASCSWARSSRFFWLVCHRASSLSSSFMTGHDRSGNATVGEVFLLTLFPLMLFCCITSTQDPFDVNVLALPHALDGLAQEREFCLGLAGEAQPLVPQSNHLDSIGANEDGNGDEECGGVPLFGLCRLESLALGDRDRVIWSAERFRYQGLPE